jgi:hypothetical protein
MYASLTCQWGNRSIERLVLSIGWAAVAGEYGKRVCTQRGTVTMALTSDAIHLSPSLSAPDPAADAGLAEGLSAIESYKKKDPTKGSDAYTAWHGMAWHGPSHPSESVAKLTEPLNRDTHACVESFFL